MNISPTLNPAPEWIQAGPFGPPLPANVRFYTFTEPAKVLATTARTVAPNPGFTLQSISLHDPAGNIIFNAALLPILQGPAIFGDALALAQAGPEQARVPFFVANVLDGTWPKDCWADKGWYLQLNNVLVVALRSATVTAQVSKEYG